MADEERKIIIDEGWKAQVEREREMARRQQETTGPPHPPEDLRRQAPAAASAPQAMEDAQSFDAGLDEDEELSHFESLASGIAAQSMMALGLMAEEGAQHVHVDLGLAKHLIDTLIMLREKTKGNLTPRENATLNEAIPELQRLFALRAQQARDATLRQQGVDPGDLTGRGPRRQT